MKRENFQSRLGFLLVSAGCAIGIGNVWKFPYVTGENGGGFFVLIYLICLLVMGVPVLTMELAVGRAGKKSAVLAYKNLEKPGQKWHIHGWFCLIGCFLLMMYYTTVTGWMVNYFGKFLTGAFHAGMDTESVVGEFGAMLSNPGEMTLWTELVVVAGFLICSFGLQNGLERVSKVMMLALLALIVVLAVHSLTLPGAAEGMKFYLLPSMDSIRKNGLGTIIAAAMNQSFFTLSLGIAAMEIFGSYMSRNHSLTGEAVRICCLDTFVAFMSGMIIFPACFSFGIEADSGPNLIFLTLPRVFVSMTGGRLWGALFFLFLTFASFTTVLAVFFTLSAYPAVMGFFRRQLGPGLVRAQGVKANVFATLGKWLKAECILLAVTFCQLLAGLLLIRQEYALLLAALIALIDALPVFGTGTVLVPWAAAVCLLGNVPKGIALLALFAVISVVRSVLEPKLVAAQAGLPPLASLAAMYVGFCAMGVAGMVLAPVLLLLVKQLHDGGYIRLWR